MASEEFTRMRLVMTLSLPREPASVTQAREVLAVVLSLTDATEECTGTLAVVITEACANAVTHGDPGGSVELTITLEAGICTLEISNRGDPTNAKFTANSPDPTQLHGRGLLLIAALSDTAEFVPAFPGQITVRITRRLTYNDPTELPR
jgi:serine/threonine-protein kinase RsbW